MKIVLMEPLGVAPEIIERLDDRLVYAGPPDHDEAKVTSELLHDIRKKYAAQIQTEFSQEIGYRNEKRDQIRFPGFFDPLRDFAVNVLEKQRDRNDDFDMPFLNILQKITQTI